MNDFSLLDISGAPSSIITHPNRSIVAYSCGCNIIVWDVLNDRKINLIGHQNNVNDLTFLAVNRDNGLYLISIDAGNVKLEQSPQMILWDWNQGSAI